LFRPRPPKLGTDTLDGRKVFITVFDFQAMPQRHPYRPSLALGVRVLGRLREFFRGNA
jgi:hypothetical protein